MKRGVTIILFLSLWFMITGLASGPMEEVPAPEKSFTATVIDDQDISTKIKDITMNGRLYLIAKRGKAVITIPFEKVKRVTLIGASKNMAREAKVTLKAGDSVGVTFDDDVEISGRTPYGTYRITLKNTKEIIFE